MRIAILILYLAVIMGIGYYASRLIKNSDDFLLAGRRLGLFAAAATLAATHFGGGYVMGVGEDGFSVGLSGLTYAVGTGLGLIALGLVAAKPLRKLGLYTITDYLELRYQSKVVRVLGALLSLVAIVGIVAAQVGATSGALAIIDVDATTGAIIATILFVAYTAFAGMWGVTMTDALQIIIIFIGLPISALLGMQAVGGWEGMQQAVAGMDLEVSTEAYFSLTGIGVPAMIGIVTPVIMYDLIGQDFYQRLFSAKDSTTSRNAAVLAGVVLVAFGVFPALSGMAARAKFGDIDPTSAIPQLVTEVLPLGIGTLVVAAIIAAVMSTADSLLIAGTSHLTNDFYRHIFNPGKKMQSKQMLYISRVGTIVLGILALGMHLAIPGIISLLIFSYTMYASGVFIPVVAGIFWKRGNAQGAIAGIIAGGVVGLLGELGFIDFGAVPSIGAGGIASLIAYVAVSLATPPPKPPKETLHQG